MDTQSCKKARDCVYLEPFLGLLLALHGQHQRLSTGKGESELVFLPPAVFGHVDDSAQAEWYIRVGRLVFRAFITL